MIEPRIGQLWQFRHRDLHRDQPGTFWLLIDREIGPGDAGLLGCIDVAEACACHTGWVGLCVPRWRNDCTVHLGRPQMSTGKVRGCWQLVSDVTDGRW